MFQITRVTFELFQVITITVGVNYVGQKQCYLKSTIFGISANEIEFNLVIYKSTQKSIQLFLESIIYMATYNPSHIVINSILIVYY